MSSLLIILLVLIPLLWNVLTVIYLTLNARKKKLTPLKFTSVFVPGLSITITMVLFIAISTSKGIGALEFGFVMLVFLINLLVGFPLVYLLSRFLFKTFFVKWSPEANETEKNKSQGIHR